MIGECTPLDPEVDVCYFGGPVERPPDLRLSPLDLGGYAVSVGRVHNRADSAFAQMRQYGSDGAYLRSNRPGHDSADHGGRNGPFRYVDHVRQVFYRLYNCPVCL